MIASSVLVVPKTVSNSCFDNWPMMPCEPWPDEKIWKAGVRAALHTVNHVSEGDRLVAIAPRDVLHVSTRDVQSRGSQ